MNRSALDSAAAEIVRRALNSCADDLTSTPSDGLAPEYVQAVEVISRVDGLEWPDEIGRELLRVASEINPGTTRLPASIPPALRSLVAAALQRYAIEMEQESGGELEDGSAEAAEVERAMHLADVTLEPAVNVDARRWSGGWELYALGSKDLVTQVENIDDAPAQVRDLLETEFPGADFSKVIFDVRIID